MESIRNHYPALAQFTYLNTCSSGLFSEEVLAYRRQLDEDYQLHGSNFRAGVYNSIKTIKTTVAEAFGATVARTALIPSCSYGINLVLNALDKEHKVLHLADDYPSIIWPFERREFPCVSIPNKSYTAEALIQQIEAHDAAILAVSMVQYSNGEIIAPQTFQAIKKRFPNLLILVDATQFFGTAPFDFQTSGIDLFAASTFKWLCAGYGNGTLFLSEQLAKVLHSKTIGYNTYKNPRMEGEPTIGEFFEPGHQDLLVFKTLQFQVEYLASLGFENIQAHIKQVKAYARTKITGETPFEVITSLNPYLESGILSVDAPKALVTHLNQNKVICSYNKGLRLGIHFYNNFEDVDRLVELMQQFKS